jgi:hypothetical protein
VVRGGRRYAARAAAQRRLRAAYAAVALLAGIGAFASAGAAGLGADAPPPAPSAATPLSTSPAVALPAPTRLAPAPAGSKHLGVATCASSLCHGSARPLETRAVFQNEYVTWSHFDPHGRAYRVLFEDTAVRMAARLGLKNAHEARECLACHSDSVPKESRGERFQLSDGIGCEACHGASESWLATHSETGTARGMRALEKPEVRAETCIRCHVGDSDRFATHQMMAAGHPRLTFELDTYTELWRTSGGREHFRRDADYLARKGASKGPGDEQFEPVHIWLTGLAATTRREADLVEQRLSLAAGGFPDFALFNCYSCHRSMRVAAWEKPADEMTPPGTLRLHDGHARALLAMLDATDDAALSAPLRSALNALQSANGNAETIRAANRELRAALAAIEKKTANRPFKRVDLEASLDALIDAAKRGTFTDYAAAEQAAMGMVLLMAELNIDQTSTDAHAHDVDEMFRTLQDDAQFDGERFARALSLLKH